MIFFLIINTIVLLLLSFIFSNISIFITGILCLIMILLLVKNHDRGLYINLSIIFCISILFMIILYYGYVNKYGSPYYLGGSDDLSFEQTANYILQYNYIMPNDLMKETQFYYHSAKGFLWVLSWFIRFCNLFGGYHTISYRVVNIYILLMLGILVFKYFSKKYCLEKRKNLIVLYAITLFPNSQYISIHVFRDTLNIFILFFIFYVWDRYSTKEKVLFNSFISTMFITLILTYISFWIRKQNLIFIIAIILLNLFLRNRVLSKKSLCFFIIAILSMIVAFNYLDIFNEIIKFNEYYTDYLLATNSGLSQKIFSMSLLPFGIILRCIFGLVSPLPVGVLQFTSMFNDIDIFFKVLISIGVILQIYLLPYLFLNLKSIDKVTILYVIFFLATVITTFTFRHFIMIYPFMWILIFRKFYETSKRTKLVLCINMSIILIMFAIIYILVK